jgi:O-antigen/teichoic acid export membrane protein
MSSVGQQMARGAAWMLLFKLMERGLGTISTVILARLLIPADFGLIAMAMAIVSLLELVGSFSFDIALIQHPSAERRHYDTAWTFNILFGLGSFCVLSLLAIPASHFYTEPRLENVMYVLGFISLTQGFENIGVVAFRKEMDFRKEFRFLLGKKIAAFIVTVTLALLFSNYWALVLGTLAGRLAGVLLSYYAHPYRPKFSLAGYHDLFHFSKWLLVNNIMFFLQNRSADFIIGKIAGPHALGIFSVAFEIANLPSTELVAPINRVSLPGYSKLASNLNEVREQFLKVAGTITLIVLPTAAGIFLTADVFVPLVLGPKWSDAINPIRILAIFGALLSLVTNHGMLYMALGKPRLVFRLYYLIVSLLLPMLFIFTRAYQETGAALAFLTAVLVLTPYYYYLLMAQLEMRFRQLLRAFWRPVTASVIMILSLSLVRFVWAPAEYGQGGLVVFLVLVLVGVTSYTTSILVLWWLARQPSGPEQFILDNIRSRLPWPIFGKPAPNNGNGKGTG